MGSSDRLANSVAKLLKIARMNADEINAGLAAIRVSTNSTETALAQLDHAILQERRRIEQRQTSDPSIQIEPTLAAYSDLTRSKRANMLATLEQLSERETAMKDALSAAFSEIKKLEHLVEIAERNQTKSDNRRMNAARDDMVAARAGRR